MLDLGWSELMVVAILTVLIFGPKELPTVLRTVTQLLSKARGVARDFQRTMDDMAREAELDKLKKDLQETTRTDNLLDPSGSDDGLFDNPFGDPNEKPGSAKKSDAAEDTVAGEGQGEAAAEQGAAEQTGAGQTAGNESGQGDTPEPKTAGKAG